MDQRLLDARDLYGAPRFYTAGQHPATYRIRAQIDKLETLPPSPERDEALSYHREQLACFEEGESIAKADFLRRAER